MPTVQDVLNAKGGVVFSIGPASTVLEAINRMNDNKLGALIVMLKERVVGIFTERDVLRRVVGALRDPARTTVAEVMTSEVICVNPMTDLDEVSVIMQQQRVRHIPVCDEDGNLEGMISIGDVNAYHTTNQQAQIHFLNEYIYGRA